MEKKKSRLIASVRLSFISLIWLSGFVTELLFAEVYETPTPPSLPVPPSEPTPPTGPIPPIEPPVEPEPPTENSGMEIYKEQCAICHGDKGQGTARGYPILYIPKSYATEVIRLGREGGTEFSIPMPAYDKEIISDYQLAEMYQSLYGISLPNSGEELYKSYCGNCHGMRGEGGMTNRPLLTKFDAFREFIRLGAGGNNYLNRNQYMPRWNKQRISDEQIQLMIDYLKESNL